ncbi:autophagy protein Apg5-domain-containing protein [Cunninghamella echinulata]|nr:autophagy protein Apg5-domain-containing protein [Cunninghamella echinulata]
MADIDKDILKSIWYGKLPLEIVLHDDANESFFFEIPRYFYLPMITTRIQSLLYNNSLDPQTIWYEYNGEPLKWHYPIGLLYDILINTTLSGDQENNNNTKQILPWRLILRQDSFPDSIILKNPKIDIMQDMYMSMVKEADFLRHGSTKKVMNLSKNDQSQLWQALSSESYDDFWSVNRHLLDSKGSSLRNVPIRLYLPKQSPVIQDIVPFTKENGDDYLLSDVLKQLLPNLSLYSTNNNNNDQQQQNILVKTHGILLPLHTPIKWASDHLSYPDNFLHLVIYNSRNNSL